MAAARARLGLGLRVLTFVGVVALGLTIVGGWTMLNRLGTEITQVGWFPRRGLFDMSTIIVGTFMIVVIAMVVAVPLGLGAAIYLSEYASPRVRRFVKPILEILAGIPSVVLAYFAITFINPNIVVRFFNPPDRAFSMLAAGIAVGVLTVPIIASVAEDALRAVPMSLREASFGLGAQRAQTTFRVVFPAGVSGIVAALILGISRAIGETMVVAIAAGAVGGALFHFSPLEARPDDDRGDGRTELRQRPGRRRRGSLPEPVLHRRPAVRDDARCSTCSATSSSTGSARRTDVSPLAALAWASSKRGLRPHASSGRTGLAGPT